MKIPQEVKNILSKLQESGFEAYAVGGCVRDLLLGREPKDWDICTNALPEKIQEIFPNSFYENKFGTVSVKTDSEKENLKIIEITTFRVDAPYSDRRHPDEISFTPNLKEDLARRDFTINAMALRLAPLPQGRLSTKISPGQELGIIDPFDGQKDLSAGLIRTVGEAEKRFGEDALRMLRAVRFFVELSSVEQVPQNLARQKT